MKRKLKDALFILILGSICTSTLLIIKGITFPKIIKHQQLKLKANILDAAGIGYTSNNLEDVFRKNIRTIQKKNMVYHVSGDNLYIFEFRGTGLWGIIQGIIALNPDRETIESIKITSHEETPGLGGRITEEEFLNQFKNKKIIPDLTLALRKKADKSNEVDAITGASVTSIALIKAINEAVLNLRKTIGR